MNKLLAIFTGVSPNVWLAIGVFVAFSSYTGAVYYAGGRGPRADLTTLKTSIAAAAKQQKAQDAARESAHDKLVKRKDDERIQAMAANDDRWRLYIAGLPKPRSGARKDEKPIPITAEGLNDAADRARVSDAVSAFRDEVRTAFREFRNEVAGQLEECQTNTDTLIRAQDWAAEESAINSAVE